MNERVLNDSAWRISLRILDLFEPVLGEVERKDAFMAIYAHVRAGLNVYEAQVDRVHQRLHPMDN